MSATSLQKPFLPSVKTSLKLSFQQKYQGRLSSLALELPAVSPANTVFARRTFYPGCKGCPEVHFAVNPIGSNTKTTSVSSGRIDPLP